MPLQRDHRARVGSIERTHYERTSIRLALRMDRFLARLEHAGYTAAVATEALRRAEQMAQTTRSTVYEVLDSIEYEVARTGLLPLTVQEAA